MKNLSYFLLIGPVSITGCVTGPKTTGFSSIETETICAMTSQTQWHLFETVTWEDDPDRANELVAIATEDDFRELPASIKCTEGRVALNQSNGLPFDKFWLSSDGTLAAISGGWFGGELIGSGGVCYFMKEQDTWQRQGCVATWAI